MNSTGLSRRSFVGGLFAGAMLPAWAQVTPANPDAVIIGAGEAIAALD